MVTLPMTLGDLKAISGKLQNQFHLNLVGCQEFVSRPDVLIFVSVTSRSRSFSTIKWQRGGRPSRF